MVIIFHSPLAANASPDEMDVLDQADYFRVGLSLLGYQVEVLPFEYDLQLMGDILRRKRPQFVVNLVETLFADGRLIHFAPALFAHYGVPYTGCSSDALYQTSNKVLAKTLMRAHDIPTPDFISHMPSFAETDEVAGVAAKTPYIIKSIWEHASFGMDEREKLLFFGREEVREAFSMKGNKAAQYFAEKYIHGREFNISMLAGPEGPEILPVAEMQFDFPPDMPRITGYRAKWDSTSFEYMHTSRAFLDIGPGEALYERLQQICVACWTLFRLSAYARIDFRLDDEGRPYVLEVNANPCIAIDSGFVAAADRAGYDQKTTVSRIIGDLTMPAS